MSDHVPPPDPADDTTGAGVPEPPPVPPPPSNPGFPPAPSSQTPPVGSPPPASVPPPVGYPPAPYPAHAPYPPADNGMGTAALVLGIVGLAGLCAYGFGIIPAILAIIFGKIGMNKVADGTANNLGSAKAGFIMGIIAVALAVIGVIVLILIIVVAAMAPSSGVSGR